MKKVSFVLLAVLLIAVSACTPKTAVVNNDALIDSLNAACAAAWNSGNAETAADFYAADAILAFENNTVYSGRDSLLAFTKSVVSGIKNMKVYRGTYAVVDDLITETGLYSFEWVGEDQVVWPNRGTYNIYFKKAENGWKPILHVCHGYSVVK